MGFQNLEYILNQYRIENDENIKMLTITQEKFKKK